MALKPVAQPEWIAIERAECESRLSAAVPAETTPPEALHRAIRYSLLSGGKRLRPLLCRAAARAIVGYDVEAAWRPACAVELIHTYSLIHDDLPALDNDDLRRGRATCHTVFGVAMAILAGDGLQTLAFEHLAQAVPGELAASMVHILASAAGTPAGMVAGQAADMDVTQIAGSSDAAFRATPLDAVRFIHARKTAALLRASVMLGGMAAGATEVQLRTLESLGGQLGLAFQIVDDLLDQSATSAELGKTAGKDRAQDKLTYPAAAGVNAARTEAQRLTEQARAGLASWGEKADHLRELAEKMLARRR